MQASILKGVSDEFTVPCKIKVWQSAGRHTLVQASFRFTRPNRTELGELSQQIQEAMKAGDFDRIADIIRGRLIGWEMSGADNQPVEFCDENIDLVLQHPDYLSGMIDAFVQLLNPGRLKAGN